MATSEPLEQVDKSLGLAYRHEGCVSSHIFSVCLYEKYPNNPFRSFHWSRKLTLTTQGHKDTRTLGYAIIS